MLKVSAFIISIFLIIIIFLRVPQESIGLSSFATKNEIFGSPTSSQRFLNIITALGVLIYLSLALKLNLSNNI